MTRLLAMILLGLALVGCTVIPSVPTPSVPADQALPFHAEGNALAVDGTLEHSTFKAGSTLGVSAKIANTGTQDISIGGCNPIVWLDVMQGDTIVAGGKPPAKMPCTLMAMLLRAGTSNQYSAQVVLPGAPGSYSLVVHATDSLATKPLVITVIP